MAFKEILKAQLDYSGISVKELALRSGVNRRTIDNYLSTHNYLPTAVSAVKIAVALGVSVEYLITGQENKCKPSNIPPQKQPALTPEMRAMVALMEQFDKKTVKVLLGIAKVLKAKE